MSSLQSCSKDYELRLSFLESRGAVIKTAEVDGSSRTACFSPCEKYRYFLDIEWAAGPKMTVIGLNPSTATHLRDDPTLRRVTGFARKLKYGGVRMLNAFAYRSTDPAELFKVADPVGVENDVGFLWDMRTEIVIAAWGSKIQSKVWKYWYQGHEIAVAITDLHCFRISKGGHPEHPLYLPRTLQPLPFSYEI